MTSTVTGAVALAAAENPDEGQLPVWLTLAVLVLILAGGYAATIRTPGPGRPNRHGGPRPPEPLGHPLDRIDPL